MCVWGGGGGGGERERERERERDFASINYLSQTPSTGYDILPATTAITGYAIGLVGTQAAMCL